MIAFFLSFPGHAMVHLVIIRSGKVSAEKQQLVRLFLLQCHGYRVWHIPYTVSDLQNSFLFFVVYISAVVKCSRDHRYRNTGLYRYILPGNIFFHDLLSYSLCVICTICIVTILYDKAEIFNTEKYGHAST